MINIFRSLNMFINLKLIYIIIIIFLPNRLINAFENQLNFNKEIEIKNEFNNLKEVQYKSEYLLGSGDLLFIKFPGLDIFGGEYMINNEGDLSLPEINKFYAEGLTIEELEQELNKEYENFIIDPNITINIIRYRPIKVYLSGEVKNPGLYNFKNGSKSSSQYSQNKVTLFDAIQMAGGVSNNSDLSKIKIKRINSQKQGGGKIQASINLLSLIIEGDQSQNIRILDGDYIFVHKSNKILKDQLLAINKTNLNPDEITVYITGNVNKAGPTSLKKGSTLIQAVASNGGKKIWTGNVEFLRFKSDGNTLKYQFKYDPSAKFNTKKNPVLMEGDIINLRKTVLGRTTEIINEIANPILSSYGLYKIFD